MEAGSPKWYLSWIPSKARAWAEVKAPPCRRREARRQLIQELLVQGQRPAMSEISVDLKVNSPTRDKAAAHRRAVSQQNSPAYVVSGRGLPRRSEEPDLSLRALVDRHRFLLVAVILLVVLCSIYLYFAISMDLSAENARTHCKGLTGEMLRSCEKERGRRAQS